MEIRIAATPSEMGLSAARHAAALLRRAIADRGEARLLLSTGMSQFETLQALVQQSVDWQKVTMFHLDEYVALPEEHPESYHSFMYRNLFDHIDIPRENIHILNGNAPDLDRECEEYELAILDAGGIDLFLGGVGEDGHLAFNEPFSSLNSRTRVMTLTQDTLEVNARFFDNDPDKVPKQAMSVGVATVCSADEVLILAFGGKKARAVQAAIEGPVSHYVTLSALQLHENGTIVLDDPAAGELKVNSYRYFKAVEAAENGK